MQDYNLLRVAEHPVKKVFERGMFLALLSGVFYYLLLQTLIMLQINSLEIKSLTLGFLFVLIPLELLVKYNHLSNIVFTRKYLMFYENSLFGSEDHFIDYKNIKRFSYKRTLLDQWFNTVTLNINNKKISVPDLELEKIKNATK